MKGETASHKKIFWNDWRTIVFLFLFVVSFTRAQAQYKIIPGADTLVFLSPDSACSMYVGFYADYDELDFFYDVKLDSTCGITDCKLELYDRWGMKKLELTELHKHWAVGANSDPTQGVKEFYYVFSYKNQAGEMKKCMGHLKENFW